VEKEVSGDTWDTAKRLMDLVKEAGKEDAESEEDEKPENRLREVRKKGFGEDEDYLRYYILASEVAICSQDA
jgi:hypothetical protein